MDDDASQEVERIEVLPARVGGVFVAGARAVLDDSGVRVKGEALETDRGAQQVACEPLDGLVIFGVNGCRIVDGEARVLGPPEEQVHARLVDEARVQQQSKHLVAEPKLGSARFDMRHRDPAVVSVPAAA